MQSLRNSHRLVQEGRSTNRLLGPSLFLHKSNKILLPESCYLPAHKLGLDAFVVGFVDDLNASILSS